MYFLDSSWLSWTNKTYKLCLRFLLCDIYFGKRNKSSVFFLFNTIHTLIYIPIPFTQFLIYIFSVFQYHIHINTHMACAPCLVVLIIVDEICIKHFTRVLTIDCHRDTLTNLGYDFYVVVALKYPYE